MYAIETKNINYKFGKTNVLTNLNLQVPSGSIYGFLGPNGAGKTTTLRLVLGLLSKQQGQIFVLGNNFNTHRLPILKQTGSLIEQPSLYGHLTGEENLRVYSYLYNVSKARIEETLKIVDLYDARKKLAKAYSLGMKQRLSIAIALLHEPKLLILDEPTNGLDPNGIIEMRRLMKKLNTEMGITILVSSHLLSEIEKLVTHVGIIHHGKLLFQGSKHELNEYMQEQARVILQTSNNKLAEQIITNSETTITIQDDQLLFAYDTNKANAEIIKKLVAANIDVYQMSISNNDLENIFLKITNQ
jgi:lantibiotic transport system ATP-binding protein